MDDDDLETLSALLADDPTEEELDAYVMRPGSSAAPARAPASNIFLRRETPVPAPPKPKVRPSTVRISAAATSAGLSQSQSDVSRQRPGSARVAAKPELREEDSVAAAASAPASGKADDQMEEFSRIAVINRLVSTVDMKSLLSGKKSISIPSIPSTDATLPESWVTFGVVASKTRPKDTAKGGKFCVLKLTDMRQHEISLFLFGDAFSQLWTVDEGTLVCIAGAKILPKREGDNRPALAIYSGKQMLKMGKARDFGYCKAYKTDRSKGYGVTDELCNAPINTTGGVKFCVYHLKREAAKVHSKRMNLNQRRGPMFEGGDRQPGALAQEHKKPPTRKKQQADRFQSGALNKLLASSSLGARLFRQAEADERAKAALATARPVEAQMDALVRLRKPQEASSGTLGRGGAPLFLVMPDGRTTAGSAADALKAALTKTASEAKRLKAAVAGSQAAAPASRPASASSSSSRNASAAPSSSAAAAKSGSESAAVLSLKGLLAGSGVGSRTALMSGAPVPAPALARPPQAAPASARSSSSSSPAPSPFSSLVSVAPLPRGPLSFDERKALAAKARAVELVRAKGGIDKPDPNDTRPQPRPVPAGSSQRVDRQQLPDGQASSSSSPADPAVAGRKRKLEEAFGKTVALQSEEGKKLLRAESSHVALADAQAKEKRDFLVDQLEKQEELAEQMFNVQQVVVKAFKCAECKEVCEFIPPMCRMKKHKLDRIDATKRFFECADCKTKAITLDLRWPNKNCRKCGAMNYSRSSLGEQKHKKVAALPSEQLLVRGEEHAFSLRTAY